VAVVSEECRAPIRRAGLAFRVPGVRRLGRVWAAPGVGSAIACRWFSEDSAPVFAQLPDDRWQLRL